ncbi:MAG: hypothetical protein MJK15_11755 [Colwellia sp.]|nr:hypothetical protein [Colwellia sp.]
MKINTLSLSATINTAKTVFFGHEKKHFSIILIILLASLSSACQMTTSTNNIHNEGSYSDYYLWLKTLNKKQVLAEEQKQQAVLNKTLNKSLNKPINSVDLSQGKLILIYSLANTPLHQPYKAKRLLNEHLLASNNMSKDDLGFTMLLRDQLNTQLHLIEQQAQARKKFNKQSDEHHAIIEQLKKQLKRVNQQLILLKKIDQNINERG